MARLCFDYGHGGTDSGAVYKDRQEKRDVLELGKSVADEIRKYGVEVDEIRTRDISVGLKSRSDFEKRGKYDYFISFHRNAYKPEQASGVETYVYINTGKKSRSLANRIQKELIKVGFRDRGVKSANFHVLRETKSPAVLIEIGFIDNTKDNILFDEKRAEIVAAISKAILEELGIVHKTTNSKPKNQNYYRVVAGSFADRKNAENQVEKLKRMGINSTIIKFNK